MHPLTSTTMNLIYGVCRIYTYVSNLRRNISFQICPSALGNILSRLSWRGFAESYVWFWVGLVSGGGLAMGAARAGGKLGANLSILEVNAYDTGA